MRLQLIDLIKYASDAILHFLKLRHAQQTQKRVFKNVLRYAQRLRPPCKGTYLVQQYHDASL